MIRKNLKIKAFLTMIAPFHPDNYSMIKALQKSILLPVPECGQVGV